MISCDPAQRIGAGSRRRATTVIETAAAIVVIAVLVACFLPASAHVASVSKQGRCLAQLAQIGYANLIYAGEDTGNAALPVHRLYPQQDPFEPSFIGAYEWGGKSGIGREGYTDAAEGPLSSRFGTAAGFGPGTRPLNRILYGPLPDYTDEPGENNANWQSDTQLDLDLHRCPSDVGYTGAHCPDFRDSRLSSFDHFGTSYHASIFMIAPGGGGEMESNSPYLHRLSDIPSPAETLAYMENNGRWAWAVREENEDCQWIGPGVPGPVRGWHGKDWTFATAFVDGHADLIYMRGYRNPKVFVDVDQQSYSRCIIVRGEGWRLDTLPAERVRTGLNHSGEGRPSYEDCVGPDYAASGTPPQGDEGNTAR